MVSVCYELKKYLKENYLPEPEKIFISDDFYVLHNYDELGKVIDIILAISGIEQNSDYNEWFLEHLKTIGLRKEFEYKNLTPYDNLAFAFLHEVGHVATLPDLNEDEITHSKVLQACCQFSFEQRVFSGHFDALFDKSPAFAYWNTPVERLAQEWVVNMVNLFPKMIKDLATIFQEHIEELE